MTFITQVLTLITAISSIKKNYDNITDVNNQLSVFFLNPLDKDIKFNREI